VASDTDSEKRAAKKFHEEKGGFIREWEVQETIPVQQALRPAAPPPAPNLQGGGAEVSISAGTKPTPTQPRAGSGSTSSKSTAARAGGGASSATPASTPTAAAPVLNEELARQYGMTLSMLNAYPELKQLFQDMVKEGWTQAKFNAKLAETNWYKTLGDSQRKAILLQYTDPATYSKLWNTTQNKIRSMMSDLGANPDNWEQVNAISAKIIHEGYTDDQARDYLGQFIVFGPGGMAGGKAGQVQQELNTYAYTMGIQNADFWTQDAVRNVVRGKKTSQDDKNEIMEQSIATFGGFEKQLRAGATMQDLAQPYMQSMSQILEIPGGNINLFDNTIRGALSWRDPSGTAGSKPLWQFQNDLRKDERWKKTQNAQDSAMGTAHRVLQDFGVVF